MTKRILAVLLAIAMVLGTCPVSAYATEVEDSAKNQVVVTEDTEANDETTTKADLIISTVEDLEAFAAAVNAGDTFAGKTVVLANDITFGENDYWYSNDATNPVDNIIKVFAGTFDGQSHIIKGLNFYYSTTNTGSDFAGPAMGLFGTVEAGGTVKNLTLDTVKANLDVPYAGRPRGVFGFLAYSLKGTAENCHVKNVTVTTTGKIREAGGMFGSVSGTAENCTATDVSIVSTSNKGYTFEDLGGFAGVVTGKLDNCHIEIVKITADNEEYGSFKKVGGFIGRTNNSSVVNECSSKNVTLSATTLLTFTGGFVGHAENAGEATYTGCAAENVTITTNNGRSTQTGGFVGEAYGVTFGDCTVSGVTINVGVAGSGKVVGSTSGFCGQTNQSGATFNNCAVTGLDMTLKGSLENGIGGFLTSTGGSGATINNCSVAGTIDATATEEDAVVGAFLGNLGWGGEAHVTISNSTADVDVEANGPAGGFVGNAYSKNTAATLTIKDCSSSGDVSSLNGTVGEFQGTGETDIPAEGEYTFTGNSGNNVQTNWSEKADISWYVEGQTEFTITTPDQLAGLAKLVTDDNTFAGIKVTLGADIDLAGSEWTTIGAYGKPFSGEFDGNGKTISNLTDASANDHKGLFAHLNEAYVHDLTLKDVQFSGTCEGALYAGALVCEAESKNVIKNVDVDGITYDITSKNGSIGGVVGYTYDSNYINCDVKNVVFKVTSTSSVNMGGFAGQGRGVGTFSTAYENTNTYSYDTCTVAGVTANVTGKTTVGGFLGCDGYNHWANYGKDCTVTGLEVNCAADDAQYTVGGFMGSNNGANYNKDYAFENCHTTGVINAVGNTNTASTFGGFLGFVGGRPVAFKDCTANVIINVGAGDVGGFVGETQQYFAHEYKFEDCTANGNVRTGNGTAGGFIANVQHGGDGNSLNVIFDGCAANNTATGGSEDTSKAFAGNVNDTKNETATGGSVTVENCTVKGNTVDSDDIGGNTNIVEMPYYISTVEELKAFVAAVNAGDNFAGKLVVLTNDIEVNDYWFNNETGIDYRITKDFAGIFDGQSHAIKGLKFQNTDTTKNPYMYLFNSISGTVKNLTLDGVTADINGYDYFGFIAYTLTGTAENCHVKNVEVNVAVASNDNGYIASSGAMFGKIAGAQVSDCTAENIEFTCAGNDTTDCVGALIGVATGAGEERSTVKNCSVKDVNFDLARKTKRLGGFIGQASNTDFTDCTATDVTIKVGTYYQSIGGFVGNASTNSTYTRCNVVNFKLIIPEDASLAGDVGGFTGYTYSSTDTPVKFTDCDVTGLDMDLVCNDNNKWAAGGFIGYVESHVDIDNCTVDGDITVTGEGANHALGAFIGTLDWTSNKTITIDDSDSTVAGDFVGENSFLNTLIIDGVVIVPKTALVSIDGGEGVLMTWPEAMKEIEGKTAVITLTPLEGTDKVSEYGIEVPAGTTLTIDLNGCTLEGTIYSEGNLTVKNGSIVSNEFTSAIESYGENAVLTIENGVTVKSQRHALRIEGGKAIINGGVFQTWGRAEQTETVHAINAGGAFATEVIINGGEFYGLKYEENAETPDSSAAVNAQNNATVTINGGKFGYGQNNTLNVSGSGEIIAKGGEFDQDPTTYVAEGYVAQANEDGTYTVRKLSVQSVEFAGTTLDVGNSLDINFYIKKDTVDTELVNNDGYYVQIIRSYANGDLDDVVIIPSSEWEDHNYGYGVTYNKIAGAQMCDTMTVQVFYADDTPASEVKTDGVREYVMRNFDKQNDKVKNLFADMLNYGAAAQEFFDYNETDLANSQMTDAQKSYATQNVSMTDSRVSHDLYAGTTLNLKSRIEMAVYFKDITADMAANMYATYSFISVSDNKTVEVQVEAGNLKNYGGNVWGVVLDELAIANAGQLVEVTVYNADGSVYGTVTDSVESYIARMSNSDAMYEYILKFAASAKVYFAK